MMRLTFILIMNLLVTSLSAQKAQNEEFQYITFKLTHVAIAHVEDIHYVDMIGTDQKYFLKLKFGPRKLDLELFETATGKLTWAIYSLSRNTYIQRDQVSSNDIQEVYTLQDIGEKDFRSCKIKFLKGVNSLSVTIDYHENTNDGGNTIIATEKLK